MCFTVFERSRFTSLQRNGCHPHDCMCFTGQNGPRAFQTPSGFIWPPGFQNVSKMSFQIAKDDLEMASKLIPEWSCFHDSITSYFHDSIHPCFHLVRYSCMLPWFHSIIFPWFHSSMLLFGPCLHASLIPFHHISMLPFFNTYLLPWVNSSMLRFYHTVWGLALGLCGIFDFDNRATQP